MSIKNLLVFSVFILLGYLGMTYLFPLVSPFVFAFLLAIAIEPLVDKVADNLHIGKNLSVLLILLFIVLIGGGIISFLMVKLIVELNILITNLPTLIQDGHQLINNSVIMSKDIYHKLPPEVAKFLDDNSKSILDQVTQVGTDFARSLLNFLTALPKIAFMIIFIIFLTYFMARDKYKLKDFLLKLINRKHHEKALTFYQEALRVGGKYLRVQIILIALTILISLVSLLALNVKYAIIFSLAIGIVSIVPAIGTGILFIPWIIYLILAGAMPLVWYIVGLFLFLIIGRHILEPKLLADTFDISALPLFFAIFVGYKILGLEGILIGVVVVVFYKILVKAQIIVESDLGKK